MEKEDDQVAIELVRELEDVILKTGHGVDEPQIANLMRQLRPLATSNDYTFEKFGQLEARIDRLCSPRKHEKWGGWNVVRQYALAGCFQLRSAFKLIDRS